MSADKIIEKFKSGKMHPNEIFEVYKTLSMLPEDEVLIAIQRSGIGDAIEMSYITAVQMKEKGTWDKYIDKWEKDKNKSDAERLEEYIKLHGI